MYGQNFSFGLLKPDCLKRGLEQEVLAIIRNAGLEIVACKRVRLTNDQVGTIWPACINQPYYPEMLEFSTASDCLVFVVKGDYAIDRLNNLVGHYDPVKAQPDAIRGRYATSCMENLIHSVEDFVQFWIQTQMFFDVAFS